MLLTEYNEAEAMELFREEGREEGALQTLAALVQEGLLSVKDAAKYRGVTKQAFIEMAHIE